VTEANSCAQHLVEFCSPWEQLQHAVMIWTAIYVSEFFETLYRIGPDLYVTAAKHSHFGIDSVNANFWMDGSYWESNSY